MRSIYLAAASLIAASQMAEASRFYPDFRDAERQRNTPKTFKIRRGFTPYLGNINLLGKSHGNGVSKRKRQREARL